MSECKNRTFIWLKTSQHEFEISCLTATEFRNVSIIIMKTTALSEIKSNVYIDVSATSQ